ncbi:MAG: RyR domain-containing protein, partial [Anaerolineales bacterium]|nr:RyR domain-containing protein [Anaerolineales bacterium]
LQNYSNHFFDHLEVFEDLSRGHSYKVYLRQAVLEFLEYESKETAFAVYRSFFDSYRITLEGETNQFIDLLDVLLSYEERAATLIDKQRDHYIHSVNVFILGLCIYTQNANFRDAFDAVNMDKDDYPFSYDTKHEEFFYRWGIASLFHDVGYPVEIIGKQISKFISFASEVGSSVEVKSHLEFDNFEELNSIAEVLPKGEFIESYYKKYPSCVYVDLLKPIDLLAHKLHLSLGVELKEIKTALDSFVGVMAKSGFIDHGFYSAIIVLRWYGYLIQSCNYKPEYFYYPVLDSASAILLHNYYKNVLLKPPFDKDSLSPREHPIAYLLILCDELQEWNREAYGIVDKNRNQAEEVSVLISDDRLVVTYIDNEGSLPDTFSTEKQSTLYKLLDMKAVFNDGFSIRCEAASVSPAITGSIKQNTPIVPRQLLDNLEKLAVAIHDLYNQRQLERHPDEPLVYPQFSDLPDALKYSNLRQARSIANKLELMGWEIRPAGTDGEVISEISADQVETLAVFEHEEWIRERLGYGWTYGEVKDPEKKISPYLVPYHELSEEVKNLDRDTIRNIPILLGMIGMAAYVKKEGVFYPEKQHIIARRLPKTYQE